MDHMGSRFLSKLPVISVCGATGTGKSKLAIDLAFLLKGEVINADAVQLYRGLDIATNKVTEPETRGVKHNLLGCLDPIEGFHYNIHQYRHACLKIIDENLEKNRLPIVCGGTHYYIEAVLWNDFLSQNAINNTIVCEEDLAEREKKESDVSSCALPLHSWPTEILRKLPKDPKDYYARLRQLNPDVAKNLHPNDIRKLQQALLTTLRSNDDSGVSVDPTIVSSTHIGDKLPSNRSYSPRYAPLNAILWLDCDLDVLRPSLDARVLDMLDRGLIRELENFLVSAAKSLLPDKDVISSDGQLSIEAKKAIFSLANEGLLPSTGVEHWCRGILQSIGFKEFEVYLQHSPEERLSQTGQEALKTAIDRMQIATRQYARRQRRWIIKRFLERSPNGSIPVYRLDVTNFLKARGDKTTMNALWDAEILQPALRILAGFLPDPSAYGLNTKHESSTLVTPEPFITPLSSKPACAGPFICSACGGRVFVVMDQWQAHLKSRSHKKRLAVLQKMALFPRIAEQLKEHSVKEKIADSF